MNFLACDGSWSALATGSPVCQGQLISITGEDLRGETLITWDDVNQIQWEIVTLFAVVFGFVVLKKVL